MASLPAQVLLIEANPDHAELFMRLLEEHRLPNRVYYLQDGQTALDYLFRSGAYADPQKSPRPDVIILGLRLPDVDGFEVLRIIKESEKLKSIPVIIFTTSETDEEIKRSYLQHANSYLVKPVGFDEFTKLIDDLGYYWFGLNIQPLP